MRDDTADTPATSGGDDPPSDAFTDSSPTDGDATKDTTSEPSGHPAAGSTKLPSLLTCLRNVYVLEDDAGAIWLAITPAAGESESGGVMPHLLPGQPVTVTGATDDGGLSVIIKGDGRTVLDASLTAYPLAAPLVPAGFGRNLHPFPLDG